MHFLEQEFERLRPKITKASADNNDLLYAASDPNFRSLNKLIRKVDEK